MTQHTKTKKIKIRDVRGNAEGKGPLEGVVVGCEGTSVGAPCSRFQHGGLHLQETPRLQHLSGTFYCHVADIIVTVTVQHGGLNFQETPGLQHLSGVCSFIYLFVLYKFLHYFIYLFIYFI